MFLIRMGVPEMEEFWDMLEKKLKRDLQPETRINCIEKSEQSYICCP